MLTKRQMVKQIADVLGGELSSANIERVLDIASVVVANELRSGGAAILPGIGRLTVKDRSARTGRNPRTGEAVEIAAKRVVKFTASKDIKWAVAVSEDAQ